MASVDGTASPAWYRVAGLRPRLRSHARIRRHRYRGELSYVLEDPVTGRYHRLSPAARLVLALLDGQRTVEELRAAAAERLGDDAPTEGEILALLGQLHQADLLVADAEPDPHELAARAAALRRRRLFERIGSPLAIRIPLLDPDRMLEGIARFARPLFSPLGAALWIAVMAGAAAQVALHFEALTGNLADRVLSAENLLLLWLTFPVVKALHELGHGVAAKVWGAEVHELGIMLLVFTPVPYVDVSGTSAFPERRRRALVAAAGVLTELLVAAFCLFAWVEMRPSPLRAVLWNAMLIAGVSTVLFNANPLLRYDGYYLLSDLLEIPNLRARANRYVLHLVRRHILGVPGEESPASAPGEEPWLFGFAVASYLYRFAVVLVIALFVAGRFFAVGVLLAAFVVANFALLPVLRGLRTLAVDPALSGRRRRAFAVTGLGLAAGAMLLVVPLPRSTVAEGVVLAPEGARVVTGAEGIVEAVLGEPGSRVLRGEVVLRLANPELAFEVRRLAARVAEFEARRMERLASDRAAFRIAEEELARARASLDRARARLEALEVRSPRDGVLLLPGHADLPGRFLPRGEAVGFVVEADEARVRVVVGQDVADRVRGETRAVWVLFADHLTAPRPGRLLREVPKAGFELPSPVLGTEGGGSFSPDPRARGGARSFRRLFEFEVLPEAAGENRGGQAGEVPRIGMRVFVRFDHGAGPLLERLRDGVRRTFLRRLRI